MVEHQAEIEREVEMAYRARQQGVEGRARVHARRAAGAAIREYFSRKGTLAGRPNAYELLGQLIKECALSATELTAAQHLVLRVDENYQLPPQIDLIADARILISTLSQRK